MIKISNFSKSYGNTVAVNNLNLEVAKGEMVGFVGKNGAGKSTTIRAMLDLIKPTSGEIIIDGVNANEKSHEIKTRLAYMPSESVFYERLTVLEVLSFCLEFASSTQEDLERLATYFELDLTKKMGELSLGNRKKVSIIQAFLKNADILVLDEPTNGLDPLMQHKFFDYLLKEKARGVTIFLSSHNLSEIETYCDKVAIIRGGELIDFINMTSVKRSKKHIVTYTTAKNETKELQFEGKINELVAQLSQLDLISLEIRNTTVTDDFIHYYKEER